MIEEIEDPYNLLNGDISDYESSSCTESLIDVYE